jgi:hypothetical protein
MVALSSLFSVMHESSKRVSETLQEVYSSDWDGHEDLKAIVGVRARHSHGMCSHVPSAELLCPGKQGTGPSSLPVSEPQSLTIESNCSWLYLPPSL